MSEGCSTYLSGAVPGHLALGVDDLMRDKYVDHFPVSKSDLCWRKGNSARSSHLFRDSTWYDLLGSALVFFDPAWVSIGGRGQSCVWSVPNIAFRDLL